MQKVIVIGAGASGMMAAITAAGAGAMVTLIEQKERIGKKLLSTGNGRCNFTNMVQEPFCYRSEDPDFPFEVLPQFTVSETIAFFLELGIYSKNRNGYLYPNSDQASAVLDALKMELKRLRVTILTNESCKRITKAYNFQVELTSGIRFADRVILAAGSNAAPVTGSDGSGYELAKGLGHTIVPVVPALVQLRCKEAFYKSLGGLRVNGKVSLYCGGKCMAEDTGEIQMTAYGISGIPVFQVSRYAAKGLLEAVPVYAVLDFMPDFSKEQLLQFLHLRIEERPKKTCEEFFVGLFHKKLADVWVQLSKTEKKKQVQDLTEEELEQLLKLIKEFRTEITETNSFEQAQICAGGVSTEEVCHQTLESKLISGLYFSGELLDVDGICGGYNLQWAWSSGHVAGREAAK